MSEQNDNTLFVSLKEFFDYRFAALKEYIDSEFMAIDNARHLAALNLDSRLDKLNELREAVTTQENKYATKGEVQLRFEAVEKDIRQLLLSRAEMSGKASQNAVIFAWGTGAAGLIAAVVSLLLRFVGK